MPNPRVSDEIKAQRQDQLAPIFAYLDRRGITRAWLARTLSISQARLWNYENGMNTPPVWFVERAIEALDRPGDLATHFGFPPTRKGQRTHGHRSPRTPRRPGTTPTTTTADTLDAIGAIGEPIAAAAPSGAGDGCLA